MSTRSPRPVASLLPARAHAAPLLEGEFGAGGRRFESVLRHLERTAKAGLFRSARTALGERCLAHIPCRARERHTGRS